MLPIGRGRVLREGGRVAILSLGTRLADALRAADHTVVRLVRREALDPDEFSWDPETFGVPPESLDGVEAVVSLGGVGVGDGRWTGRFKQELRDSRITPTEVIAEEHFAAAQPRSPRLSDS